ncbi:MAG: Hsp70 family protein, partial [Firmicutes bacterium]|nr:Hsp70 family protein [Candidatus Scatoplasma merdavium]
EIETRNRAEQLLTDIDDSLAKGGDKIDEKTKAEVTKLRDEVKSMLDKNDIEGLKSKLSELERQAAYAQQQAQAGQAQSSANSGEAQQTETGEKKDDNVYDADFTEKK